MNNFIGNYEIILKYLKETCEDLPSYHQIRKPKMSNLELAAVNITAEYMSINTGLQLFRCLKGTCLEAMIERSVYNRRRKKLFHYIESIRQRLSESFADFTDVFIVDSMPTPICKTTRAGRSTICSTNEIQPSYGYCAAKKAIILVTNYMLYVMKMAYSILLI